MDDLQPAKGKFHLGEALPYDVRIVKKTKPRSSVLDIVFNEEASNTLSTGLLDDTPDILQGVLLDTEDEEPFLECQRNALFGPYCPSMFYLLQLFTGLLLTTFQVPLMSSVNAVLLRTESLVLDP
jgi:hypothetical protein